MSGYFITFEGPEGSGKSTQVELLAQALADRRPLVVREPGGTELGEQIRELLLHTPSDMSPEAEMHLFMAARAELLAKLIKPALGEGRIVIDDRYHDSTMAYQGAGRGAPAQWPASFPKPDRTFLLLLPAEDGLDRLAGRGAGADRLEGEPLAFHRRVVEAYERMARAEPRFVRIDATRPAGEVHADVLANVLQLLKEEAVRSS
jgi:dTMP kinase